MPLDDDSHLLRERAESFGRIAQTYDRVRPTYPDALVVDLVTRGGRDALDVACGTGIVARLLAAKGMRVLGVEIDPAMAAVARASGTEVEVAAFEEWDDAGRRFDLLTCGQAWHWIDPDRGAARAAQVLRPGGTLALLWNLSEVDEAQRPVLDAVYAEHAPQLSGSRSERRRQPTAPIRAGLTAAGFAPPVVREFPWVRDYPVDVWLDLLSTYSDHQLLPADQRATLFGALAGAMGGTVRARLDTKLVTALWQG